MVENSGSAVQSKAISDVNRKSNSNITVTGLHDILKLK